ncbi:hypothetical protein B0H16DRAFT_1665528 [Mycena metata]|uniref:Uncharacterized protein n=1 Tax=Mycena metata TaxID=1033252 RepID=A0AAD7MP17_9AGAR|nr:hypothetical protein B0H16DRAFT_1665845 [Mycena metata]KAJ7728241.1 hypothetical protein B0H16DRAFT_1665528 [Mycena metata]
MLFYPILLPWPILLHALGLTTLGLRLLFAKPTAQAPEDTQYTYLDLATAYVPIASNQFLHASSQIRVVLAVLAGLKWLMKSGARNATLYTKRNTLLGVFLYDGLGGLLLGWYLGTLSGRVLEFR